MVDETEGKIGPADESKKPQKASDPIDEVKILEEHVVEQKPAAVAPATPLAPTATSEDVAATAATSFVTKAGNDIAKILQGVKLPERRAAEKPAQAKTFDTQLSVDPAKKAEADAAKEEALKKAEATARAITESLPTQGPKVSDDVRALHTLKDDLQEVVRDKKISLVRAVALEEEKRHHGSAVEEHLEQQVKKQSRTRYTFFVAGILFFFGLLAIGAVLYVMAERQTKAAAPITSKVLFAEQAVPISVGNLAAADIRREIGNARTSAGLTLGAILQIVPIEEQVVNGQSATVPISTSQFLEKIGSRAPGDLGRALSSEFFFGLHAVDENAPIIVIPVTSYERAFAAMLEWEGTINTDLAPMFTLVNSRTTGPDGLPVTRTFEDTIMRNYDVRALKDDRGEIQLYYSFPTRNILIIAESPYSFSEILSRLRADRRL